MSERSNRVNDQENKRQDKGGERMQAESVVNAYQMAEEMVSKLPRGPRTDAAFQVLFERLLVSGLDRDEKKAPRARPMPDGQNGHQIRSQTQRRIVELRESGFFKEPKRPEQVRSELKTLGHHHNASDVRMGLLRLAQKRELRRIQEAENVYLYAQV